MINRSTLLIAIFCLISIDIFANFPVAPAQGNWQWRNDDGSESGSTLLAGNKTAITITDFSNIRIRIELYDFWGGLGSGSNTQDYALLYSLDSTNWVQITSDATSNAFALSPSSYFDDGNQTTELITPTRTNFQPGSIFEATSSFNFTLNANSATQLEYCISPTSNVQATTIYAFSLGYSDNKNVPFTAFGTNFPTLLTDSAVPVELVSFTANAVGKGVILNWTTATEVNNYGFEIQRSDFSSQTSEKEWETLGFVDGHGNSNSPKIYSFIDNDPPGGKLEYRLKQIDTDGRFEYSYVVAVINKKAKELVLGQNFPNPFNPSTTINYTIPARFKGETSKVKITLFDLLGREIATLVNKQQQPGNYEVVFDASSLPSGTYIYRLQSGGFIQNRKMILLK